MNRDRPETGPFLRILTVVLASLYLLSLGWLVSGNIRSGANTWQVLTSAFLLSIPLILLYLSIGILIAIAYQKQADGSITGGLKTLLYRTPRVAGILFAVFVGMFALDVFDAGYGFWEALGAFLIHAAPAIFMAIVVVLAWKREWIGFVAFLAAALFFLRFAISDLSMILIFSGPMTAIALLFGANWFWRDELHGKTTTS